MKNNSNNERRAEKRMSCHWPIWYVKEPNIKLKQGQMIDISSRAASFTCYSHENHLLPDQNIVTNFSLPIYGLRDSFALRDFTRSGCVLRIDSINKILFRIVTQFVEMLSFKPGEQESIEADFITLLK